MPTADFTHVRLPAVGKTVHRLGLALNYGLDEEGLGEALDAGLNYLFLPRSGLSRLSASARRALSARRERLVIATGPSLGYLGGQVRRAAERLLRALDTDYLDVFHLFWLGRTSAWSPSTVNALRALKQEGKVLAIGISIHDRPRAAQLAQEGVLDVLMLRYNAAHPGAERDVFPLFPTHRPTVVAYTATDWRKLLHRPRGWEGPVMTAGDCYRFALSSPYVDVVLSAPADRAQLAQNLSAMSRGPLTAEEERWMRAFGAAVRPPA